MSDSPRKCFTADELDRLDAYCDLFVGWNKKFSFSAIPDTEVFRKLIAPSAWLGQRFAQLEIGVVADFGAGAGIPGLPMALMDEVNRYLVIESNGKKAGFMRHVVSTLSLDHVEVQNIRLGPKVDLPQVNAIVSRAAGEMTEVLGLFEGKLAPGAQAAFFKGSDAEAEIEKLIRSNPSVAFKTMDVPAWFDDLKVVMVNNISPLSQD